MQDIELTNASGKLCLHRQSLRGRVQDYIISFDEEVADIQMVVGKTFDLFQQLMTKFEEDEVKARLIAQVSYLRLNELHEIVGEEDYHFSSYQMEKVMDVPDFYNRHLAKVASRMDAFHQNGSRLLIHRIKHIHISMMVLSKQKDGQVTTRST